jgi:septal ring factor EnvC (AmiA/AmiB activator)
VEEESTPEGNSEKNPAHYNALEEDIFKQESEISQLKVENVELQSELQELRMQNRQDKDNINELEERLTQVRKISLIIVLFLFCSTVVTKENAFINTH